MKVRTRYAPSPTGFFHIGGARTALYNYLYAKHMRGEFIVRIEDTDFDRNVEGGVESQLSNIAWMQISPDESPLNPGMYGPYKQTEKLERYQKLAYQLVEEKKAYLCFCSKEQLDQDREKAEKNHETPKYNRRCLHLTSAEIATNIKNNIPYVIRLKMNEHQNFEWDDLIRGNISIPGSALTDPVILKSNNIAMYNFAVVIDDYDMEISHILRGEEHISNTPYQIAIKSALGFEMREIRYGHLSIIVNDQGKKLSKRDTTLKQFIEDYQKMGYLPAAVDNFLALLGWSAPNNQEILNLVEMINNFDIENLSKSPARFDIVKMNWISNQHFKKISDTTYLEFVKPFILSNNKILKSHFDKTLLLFKNNLSYASELNNMIEDLFSDSSNRFDEIIQNEIKNNISIYQTIFQELIILVKALASDFLEDDITKMIKQIQQKTSLSGKNLFMPIRVLATNKMHGPELSKTLFLLGKTKIIDNINYISGQAKAFKIL